MIGELARRLQAGEVSSRELVGRSLQLIEAGDGWLGAVVALRTEQALAEAADSDRRRAASQTRGPLEGLPVLVKGL